MNAAEVKAALRRRHPAENQGLVGPWTVLEEVFEIDVLAVGANARPVNASRKVTYPRVGYEVKVSRSDYRTELLKPSKREFARGFCSEFYFAVPKGLLKEHEVEFDEPEWFRDGPAFARIACRGLYGSRCFRNESRKHVVGFGQVYGTRRISWGYETVCPVCNGKGYLEKSPVERAAPTLWVPRDVGLVEVSSRGCKVVKKSPVHEPPPLTPYQLGTLVRWVSVRPDPRHERWWKAA